VSDQPVPAGQLLWRCRRGMRELDELLTRWLRERYGSAAPDTQADFRTLLELPDPEIASYLLGRSLPADDRLQKLVLRILEHRPVVE
jgi:antitoxin CptB